MDDEDSKVRRNLVMASSAILLSAWLGIPVAALLEKVLPGSSATQEPWRYWVAEFAVLIYLAIRYRFAEEGALYQSTIKSEFESLLSQRGLKLAQDRANSFTRFGRESGIFQGQLASSIAETSLDRDSTVRLGRPYIRVAMHNQTNPPWEFEVTVSFAWYDSEGLLVASNSGKRIKVVISGVDRLQLIVQSKLHFWTYSAPSIRYIVPVVLGLMAAVTLLFKVFTSLATIG